MIEILKKYNRSVRQVVFHLLYSYNGLWETVGGRIEENETPEQALVREIKEEINSDVGSYKFFKDYYFDNRVFKTFVVKLIGDPNPNKEDFDDFGWFSKDEINNLDFAIDCKQRIIDYFDNN